MAEKQQIGFFRVAMEEVKGLLSKATGADISANDIIDYIVTKPKGERKPRKLEFTAAAVSAFKPYQLAGYYVRVPTDFPWANFFATHLKKDHEVNEDLLSDTRTFHKSFFIFIYDESKMYCFSGGLGYHFIKNFVDDGFGISVLEAFKGIRETEMSKFQTRNIVGNVATDERTFRDVHRVGDEQNIGRVYRSAIARLSLNKELESIKHIIFPKINSKKNAHAGQSFKFSSSVSLKDIKELVTFFDKLKIENKIFAFSPMKPIKKDKAHSKHKIEILNANLGIIACDHLLAFNNGQQVNTSHLYEISHKFYEDLYRCDRLVIKRRGKGSMHEYDGVHGLRVENILRDIIKHDSTYLNEKIKELKKLRSDVEIEKKKYEIIDSYSIECFDTEYSETSPVCSDKISQYFTAEVFYQERAYFYLDGVWYLTEENFLGDLNAQFSEIFSQNQKDLQLFNWGKKRNGFDGKENENSYLHHLVDLGKSNTLVLHRIKPKTNMELCDFLFWDKENIYMCHVKPSFDGNVRILTNQIQHACKLVQENIRTGLTDTCYLAQYFNAASKFKGTAKYEAAVKKQFEGWTLEKFYKLFLNRNIHHVACIVDPSKRSLANIKEFDSNIAKLCVIDGFRSMRASGNPNSRFLIYQITNS